MSAKVYSEVLTRRKPTTRVRCAAISATHRSATGLKALCQSRLPCPSIRQLLSNTGSVLCIARSPSVGFRVALASG